jgi:hypothetical protein
VTAKAHVIASRSHTDRDEQTTESGWESTTVIVDLGVFGRRVVVDRHFDTVCDAIDVRKIGGHLADVEDVPVAQLLGAQRTRSASRPECA